MHIYGIVSFPKIFVAKPPKGSKIPNYGLSILLPADDPQVADIQAAVAEAKSNDGNYSGNRENFGLYDDKCKDDKSYMPQFSGWYIFTCTAKEEDKPVVVNMNHDVIIDPGAVPSGTMVWVDAAITVYHGGTGGVGGWLNGVMVTEDEMTMGRLDGRPSASQMFAGVGDKPTASAPKKPAPPKKPAKKAERVMTGKDGYSYQDLKDAEWSDEQMIDGGYLVA